MGTRPNITMMAATSSSAAPTFRARNVRNAALAMKNARIEKIVAAHGTWM